MGLCSCPSAGRRVGGGGQGCAIGCCHAGQGPRAAVASLGPPSALGPDVLSLLGQLLAVLLRSPRLSLQRLRSCRREAVQLSGVVVALQQLLAPRCGLLGSPSRSHIAMVLQLHVSRHLQHLQVCCHSAAATSAALTDIQLLPSHRCTSHHTRAPQLNTNKRDTCHSRSPTFLLVLCLCRLVMVARSVLVDHFLGLSEMRLGFFSRSSPLLNNLFLLSCQGMALRNSLLSRSHLSPLGFHPAHTCTNCCEAHAVRHIMVPQTLPCPTCSRVSGIVEQSQDEPQEPCV